MPTTDVGPPFGRSPYNYFQERYCSDPWAVLACAVMLNQTSGKQLELVHERVFSSWSSCYSMAVADTKLLQEVIKPLGLYRRRATTLVRMSAYYAFVWDGVDPTEIPGVGKYGSDSYRIFIDGIVPADVTDKELKKYLTWCRGNDD